MYFPQQLTKLAKVADCFPIDSLGTVDNGALLALFKRHCALPSDSTWTEADAQLSLYLDNAEEIIEEMTGTPYRPHSYTLDLQSLNSSVWLSLPMAFSSFGVSLPMTRFTGVRLPVFPIDPESVTFSFTDDEGTSGSFVNGTDFKVKGAATRSPEVIMMAGIEWPSTGLQPYPFTIGWDCPAGFKPSTSLMAIMQYASYLYRNPEGMGQEVPDMGQAFWGTISLLSGTFL